MGFASGLKAARIKAGLSQKELAVRSGVSQQGISNIENEQRAPVETTMLMLASALGYTVSELIGETQDDVDQLTADEKRLISDYRALNAAGQAAVRSVMAGFMGNPDMRKKAAASAEAS